MKKLLILSGTILTMFGAQYPDYPQSTTLGTNDLVLIAHWNGSSWSQTMSITGTNIFQQIINSIPIPANIWTVDTNGTIQATSAASGFPSLLLSDTNNSPGFNINVGGSPYWSGQGLYWSVGAPAPDLSQYADRAVFLVGIGDSVLGASTISNAYHIYGIGDFTLNSSSITDSQHILAVGNDVLDSAIIASGSHDIILIGAGAANLKLYNSSEIYSFGNNLGGPALLTNNTVHGYFLGQANGTSLNANNVSDFVGIGVANLNLSTITASSAFGAHGNAVLQSANIINSSDFYGYGDGVMTPFSATNTIFVHGIGDSVFSNASLTNASRIYGFGYHSGEGLVSAGLTDVMLFGSSTQPSQSHQMTFNVDAGSGTPYRLQMGLTNLFQVTDVGAIKTIDPAAGTSQAWKLGAETVVSTVTNLIVSVGSQKYRIIATPIP